MAHKTGMLAGFKEFISRGNAIDLAVGVVIGAAFTGVITALVEKILNPAIGMIFGKPNFDTLWVIGTPAADGSGAIYPFAIVTALINFLIVACALYFAVVLPLNKMADHRAAKKAPAEETPEATPADVLLLTEIRDLLARQ